MDLELPSCDESEETCNKDEDYSIDSVFEQERCGICIDIVIDRGMLDCCDHWFCFACVDSWATITNLCPICRNEFQLITCLPVYGTFRSVTSEEHPGSKNEDWSVQGNNNTLSFPSYYISEDAVKCLENDGCKLQSALHYMEEDLNFDTSIACDSCDIWYHAFCVGFNPEFTSENSWLCPRCINNEMLQKSGAISLQSLVKYSSSQTTEVGSTVNPSLSGKISVSVADAGETAVVVSMISGKQETLRERFGDARLDSNIDIEIAQPLSYSDNETSETALQQKDGRSIQVPIFRDYQEHCTNASDIDNSSEIFFDLLPEIIDFKPYADLKEASVSSFSRGATIVKPRNNITELGSPPRLEDMPFSLCQSEANVEGKSNNAPETRLDSVFSYDYMDISSVAACTSEVDDEPEKKSSHNADTCLPSTSGLAGDIVSSCNMHAVLDICPKSMESVNSAVKPYMDKARAINMDENSDCIRKREHEDVFPVKKSKLDDKFKTLPAGNQSTLSYVNDSSVFSRKNMFASVRYAKQKEAEDPNIMSIIQECNCIAENKLAGDKKNSTCGLRVKKIMRRVGDERKSAILALEIGNEIREVVKKKSSKEVGRNDIDEKLLAAFRAAMVRPRADLTSRSERVHVGSKKFFVKGKKRENLTKRIYGTSCGRRRHAWARDLEIEFWKHRCNRAQYEKVETLQSVLELLKKATNPNWNSYTKRDSQEESTNSILSRVYIADASVFPRKDDIKPLSALSGSSHLDNYGVDKEKSLRTVANRPLSNNRSSSTNPIHVSKSSVQLKKNSSDSISKKINAAGFEGVTLNPAANSCKAASDTIQSSVSSCSKEILTNSKVHSCTSDAKSDKRKWALEVLARKSSSTNMNADEEQEKGSLLKGKYPLSAQLPEDMRPVLASTIHNKVSRSIRQAQLYRITEHYLRRANVPVIRRTAETELAVADAVNVEKEIFERSNSKLVYVNLCSQTVSQLANMQESAEPSIPYSSISANEAAESIKMDIKNHNKSESADTNISGLALRTLDMSTVVSEDTNSDPEAHDWSITEKALRMAGLFSESLPSSPYFITKDSNQDDYGNENVIESPNDDAECNAQHSINKEVNAPTTQDPGKAVYDCISVGVKVPCSFSNSLGQRQQNRPENCDTELRIDNFLPTDVPEMRIFSSLSMEECDGRKREPVVNQMFEDSVEVLRKSLVIREEHISSSISKEDRRVSVIDSTCCISDPYDGGSSQHDEISAEKEELETRSTENLQSNPDNIPKEEIAESSNGKSEPTISVSKKVEAYIKEHIRPLCKSGVITEEQYRYAVGKTLVKVMKFHHSAKSAKFLIREGTSIKKLAEQYVKAAHKK